MKRTAGRRDYNATELTPCGPPQRGRNISGTACFQTRVFAAGKARSVKKSAAELNPCTGGGGSVYSLAPPAPFWGPTSYPAIRFRHDALFLRQYSERIVTLQ